MSVKSIVIDKELIYYVVDHAELDEFEKQANEIGHHLNTYIPEEFKDLNFYNAVCNVWIALKTHYSPFFLDESRRMQNAMGYFQLELIETYNDLKKLIEYKKMSGKELIIFSFYLTLANMNWLMDILKRNDKLHLIQPYINMKGIREANTERILPSLEQIRQKELIYLLRQELLKTSSLQKSYEDAVHQARKKTIELKINNLFEE